MMSEREVLLEVRQLNIDVHAPDGDVSRVVHDLSFTLPSGRTLGIVGESGSGKSLTANAIMGILPEGISASGQVTYKKRDLLTLSSKERRALSGPDIAFIFQEPMSALHPTMSIGRQMARPMQIHLGLGRNAALERAEELLDSVGIPPSRGVLKSYVHQLSGGMRQRVMIAMSISCNPTLLIADEPTTALDATVQKQILELLLDLKEKLDLSLILISHDLALVGRYADEILVMLDGYEMESGPTDSVLHDPSSSYTRGLLAAAPRLGERQHRLPVIDKTIYTRGSA